MVTDGLAGLPAPRKEPVSMDEKDRERHVGNPDDPNLDPYGSESEVDPGAVDADDDRAGALDPDQDPNTL